MYTKVVIGLKGSHDFIVVIFKLGKSFYASSLVVGIEQLIPMRSTIGTKVPCDYWTIYGAIVVFMNEIFTIICSKI